MRKLVAIVVVFAGLLAFVMAASALVYPISFLQTAVQSLDVLMLLSSILGFVPSAVLALVGYYLIRNRDQFAARWFDDEPFVASPSVGAILPLGVLLIGLWLLITGISSTIAAVVGALQNAYLAGSWSDYPESFPLWLYSFDVSGPLIELGIGWTLIKRARQVSDRLLAALGTHESASVTSATCPACGAPYNPEDYSAGVSNPRCAECGGPLDLPRE